jgi:hypothetical protein
MLHLQLLFQIGWLAVASLLVYSNYIHRGPDHFGLALILWSTVAIGTALLVLRKSTGLALSAASAILVVAVVGLWAILDLLEGIPHGPRHEGNPLVIFESLLYICLAVIPALLTIFLSLANRRAINPRSSASP